MAQPRAGCSGVDGLSCGNSCDRSKSGHWRTWPSSSTDYGQYSVGGGRCPPYFHGFFDGLSAVHLPRSGPPRPPLTGCRPTSRTTRIELDGSSGTGPRSGCRSRSFAHPLGGDRRPLRRRPGRPAVLHEHRLRHLRRPGRPEVPALPQVAPQRPQARQLRRRLHPLRRDPQAQRARLGFSKISFAFVIERPLERRSVRVSLIRLRKLALAPPRRLRWAPARSPPLDHPVAPPQAPADQPLHARLGAGPVGVAGGRRAARSAQAAPATHEGPTTPQGGLPGQGGEAGAVPRRVAADEAHPALEPGDVLAGGGIRWRH